MLYRIKPDGSWAKFPCTGCDVLVRAPASHQASKARLCLSCYEGWRAFSDEVERRNRRKDQ